MPHRKQDPKSQFDAVEELLTRWLKERREILGKYTEIAVSHDAMLGQESLQARQASLCELLVDYVKCFMNCWQRPRALQMAAARWPNG